jgi:hypothetical protein
MKGSRLCGGVRYEVHATAPRYGYNFGYQHCSRCRKASGIRPGAHCFVG